MESICKDCGNLITFKVEGSDKYVSDCVFGTSYAMMIVECTHFKPKPKQDNTIEKAKKSLKGKGQTYKKIIMDDSNKEKTYE